MTVSVLVFCAGFAALSWEVLWQLRTSLALGVSAWGAAVTLATTMGGMALGSFLMGERLKRRPPKRPLDAYGLMELIIGSSGLLLGPGFAWLEGLDSKFYLAYPSAAPVLYLVGIALLLGPPTMAMGATIPVLGLVARNRATSVSFLYALNTCGAALGALLVALFVLPALGVTATTWMVAGVNLLVAATAFLLPKGKAAVDDLGARNGYASPFDARRAAVVVLVTGFATFALEIAWFRSLRACFQSTTDSFAIMLASVLLALAMGARLAPWCRRRGMLPEVFLVMAGVMVLLATPLVERFDLLHLSSSSYYGLVLMRLAAAGLVLGLPIACIGVVLPWLLDCEQAPRQWARLYALNTAGSILGALSATWLLLPALGFARTAWAVGLLLSLTGLAVGRSRGLPAIGFTLAALLVAAGWESGVGRTRVQTLPITKYEVLYHSEGPDASVTVIEAFKNHEWLEFDNHRWLVIDGFVATGDNPLSAHYMAWMGHLPMLLHPDPQDGLVICFGTGQTANAVRREGVARLDVVDISSAVLGAAHLFKVNEGVLEDPRVTPTVMDGRAWLRRTERRYDVITLEPMPPNFAGVNALYSLEFYHLARHRLKAGGIVAQWVPFHLLTRQHAVSIATTFRRAFPNCAMWIDPVCFTGILVGCAEGPPLGSQWPGLQRATEAFHTIDAPTIKKSLLLDAGGVERFSRGGTVITDDNQDLAYGAEVLRHRLGDAQNRNLRVVHWAASEPPPSEPTHKEILKLQVKPRERRFR